jgi:heme-degrading monooxygenase HmoA
MGDVASLVQPATHASRGSAGQPDVTITRRDGHAAWSDAEVSTKEDALTDINVVRIWRTGVDPQQISSYKRFAQSKSLPMFRAHAGFLGVFFTHRDDGLHAVITLWQDRASVEALEESPIYLQTVRELESSGLLVGESSVEVFDVEAYGGREGNF